MIINEIYLMLTERCLNNCEYCYIKNKDNPKIMSFEMIEGIIKEYNPLRIIFFGGEPLLELDLIEKTMSKYYGKIKFQIVTSATVNYKEYIKNIYSKYPLNEFQLSWDGFNENRPYKNSLQTTSYAAYENILWTIEQGIHFDIKCVISNENVKDMYEIHKTFLDLRSRNVSGQFVIAHREFYSDEFFGLLDKGIRGTMIIERLYKDYLNKIIAYLQKDRNYMSCDAGKYIVITPDYKIEYCTALSQYDYNLDSDTLQKSCKHENCIQCEYNYLCDGGCRYERILKYENNWESNYLESTCKVVKIYNNAIKDFINSVDKNLLLQSINKYKNYQNRYQSRLKGD